jgi:hypothetical protein
MSATSSLQSERKGPDAWRRAPLVRLYGGDLRASSPTRRKRSARSSWRKALEDFLAAARNSIDVRRNPLLGRRPPADAQPLCRPCPTRVRRFFEAFLAKVKAVAPGRLPIEVAPGVSPVSRKSMERCDCDRAVKRLPCFSLQRNAFLGRMALKKVDSRFRRFG